MTMHSRSSYSPLEKRVIFAHARELIGRDVERDFDEGKHPRDSDGRWTDGGGESDGGDSSGGGDTGYEFVSPNVRSDLDFKGAVDALNGAQQQTLREASAYINDSLGVSAQEHNIVGAWADGAENSVMDIVPHASWDKLVLSGAMKGHLADQKQVLIFQQHQGGETALYKFEAQGNLADIHKNLLEDGLGFHTLVPHKGGATVYVADLDGSAADAIVKGSARYDADVQVQFGQAKFLGDTSDQGGTDREQRDRARQSYEADIRESKVQASADIWDRVRDRWGAQAKGLSRAGDLSGDFARPHGEVWRQAAQSAVEAWHEDHHLVHETTIALVRDIDMAMAEAQGFNAYRDWYDRHCPFAKQRFDEKSDVYLAEALAGGWNRAPADRHLKYLLFKNPVPTSSAQTQADVTEAIVSTVADEMGWTAAELRAVVWCVDKARIGNANSGLIFDYLKYMRAQEARVRSLVAAHATLTHRSGLTRAADDVAGHALTAEAAAWEHAELLLAYFDAIHDIVADDVTPQHIARVLQMRDYDESKHPRDDGGRWTDGGEGDSATESGGGGAAATSATGASGAAGKTSSKIEDFEKDKVEIVGAKGDKAKADKFVKEWDERVGTAPAAFRERFLGGLNGTMRIADINPGKWDISGTLKDGDRAIGDYRRTIDWHTKTAGSEYFALKQGERGKDTGKQLLAANIATYKQLGIEKVTVHANIDVGGYAWAKYGYVPTRQSWADLSSRIARKIDGDGRSSSGDTYTPESWDEISSDDQDNIKDAWMRSTRDEFIESEVENWRDSGQALDDAKYQLADNFDGAQPDDWATEAVEEVIATFKAGGDGQQPIPYTAEQILASLSAEEYQSGYEGRKDPDFTFDDDKLRAPSDAPDPAQLALPGIKTPDLSTHLTEDARSEITDALTKAFNDKAESDAGDIEPPEYLSENVEEYQSQSWDDMRDRDKYNWARDNDRLPEHPIDDEDSGNDEPVDVGGEADILNTLANSNDPKALWAISDTPQGKDLLLGSDWYGELNLKDKESMARFDAYVGKSKRAAA